MIKRSPISFLVALCLGTTLFAQTHYDNGNLPVRLLDYSTINQPALANQLPGKNNIQNHNRFNTNLTIETTSGRIVDAYTSQELPVTLANNFPFGKVNFSVVDMNPGARTVVTLTLPENSSVQNYWKFGPTPDEPQPHWYRFEYDGRVGAEINGHIIKLHYIDGALGDDDLSMNGVIVDPGGPTIGTPTFSNIPLYGDVNFDGSIASYDAATTLQYSVGLDPLPDIDPVPWTKDRIDAADVDGNSIVQAYDAALILQHIVGLIDEFPVNTGTPKRLASNNINLNYSQDNQEIVITSGGDENLIASNLTFSFSSEELEFDSAATTIFSKDYMLVQNDSSGKYHVGLVNAQPPSGEGELLRIPVRVLADSAVIEITEVVNSQDAVTREITVYQNPSGNGGYTNIPTENRLYHNYPNPFNPTTTIEYDLKSAEKVSLTIYNLRGEKVKTLVNAAKPAGNYRAEWDGTNDYNIPVSSGMYFTRLRIGDSFIKTSRMVLLR